VNWRHFQAFVWLRWRLLANQWRKAGTFNAVLMMIVAACALIAAIPLFIGSFMLALYAIPKAAPAHLMYAWDGLIGAFLFFWSIGVITELQRTEPLSLSKFMHLPVSPNGAFLINYFSSLIRLSLIVFGPVMLAYCLALVWTKGTLLLPVLPSLAAFLIMVTALTYQLQGWLASLMSNPRRRRTVVVATTMIFVLVVQLPNLVNFIVPWNRVPREDSTRTTKEELTKLERSHKSGEFDANEYSRRLREVAQRQKHAIEQSNRATADYLERMARLVNLVLPFGWLPLGVAAGADGSIMPSILGLLGMTLIGAASLWRAYRTTVGMYQGQSTQRKGRPAPAVASYSSDRKLRTLLLEAHLPGASEPVSAVALGGLRSLIRSPEAKMMLLTPVIMVPIFGSMLWRSRNEMPEPLRPVIAIAGMVLVLFGVLPLMGNQFGFDRDGFRVFVLCAASRRDILLGKNLAFAPVTLGLSMIVLTIVQLVCPMGLAHFLAMFPQCLSMFLLFCIFTNLMSILTPIHVAPGSLKASNPTMKTVLLQLVMFLILFPLTQAPTLLPLGTEAGMRFLGWGENIPICLIISLAELAVVVVLYYLSLVLLGDLLQAREQKILECVTKGAS
jgi:ABC-2 type transport system permease protein